MSSCRISDEPSRFRSVAKGKFLVVRSWLSHPDDGVDYPLFGAWIKPDQFSSVQSGVERFALKVC